MTEEWKHEIAVYLAEKMLRKYDEAVNFKAEYKEEDVVGY